MSKLYVPTYLLNFPFSSQYNRQEKRAVGNNLIVLLTLSIANDNNFKA